MNRIIGNRATDDMINDNTHPIVQRMIADAMFVMTDPAVTAHDDRITDAMANDWITWLYAHADHMIDTTADDMDSTVGIIAWNLVQTWCAEYAGHGVRGMATIHTMATVRADHASRTIDTDADADRAFVWRDVANTINECNPW